MVIYRCCQRFVCKKKQNTWNARWITVRITFHRRHVGNLESNSTDTSHKNDRNPNNPLDTLNNLKMRNEKFRKVKLQVLRKRLLQPWKRLAVENDEMIKKMK